MDENLSVHIAVNTNVYKSEKYLAHNALYMLFAHTQITNEPHSHDFLELAYILDGECTHILNGTQTKLKKGDYVIIDYNNVHNYVCDNDGYITLIDCLFVPELIDRTLAGCKSFKKMVSNHHLGISFESLKFNPSEYIFHDDKGYIKQLLTLMTDEFDNPRFASADIARHCIYQILLLTLREISASSTEQASELIQYIIDACKNRYNEKKLLDSISKELHYSKPYISTKFKKETGKPFKDYLVEIRIDAACRLLHSTNKKVSEISALVGYNDVAFFISIFKSKTGLTPMQFRSTIKTPQTFTDTEE